MRPAPAETTIAKLTIAILVDYGDCGDITDITIIFLCAKLPCFLPKGLRYAVIQHALHVMLHFLICAVIRAHVAMQ